MNNDKLIPHLFRTEYGRIVSVLCKSLGLAHMSDAEDIASETFAKAVETWSYNGIPAQPVAWLYAVARNIALNQLKRRDTLQRITSSLPAESSIETVIDITDNNITDSQLQMLFAICHPALPPEAQVALALRVLCGFGIGEVANAFLTNKETINKRLFRAKEKLKQQNIAIIFPPSSELPSRLNGVLTTLYLLFSEGYYSESSDQVLRKDLCLEAMRLTLMLIDCRHTNIPAANALLALMCFHASRFKARTQGNDHLLFAKQDKDLWDEELIARGVYYLHAAGYGGTLTTYHYEASIAWWHTQKEDKEEKWKNILQLYNGLLSLQYTPVAALNRLYAIYRIHGPREAIQQAEKLNMQDNRYYHALLAELWSGIDADKAIAHHEHAQKLMRR